MLRATALALIAGYADTVGYLHLNAFAGLMTGNTIFMGMEIATGKYREAAFHAAIIAMFLFGVVFGRIIVRAGLEVFRALLVTSGLLIFSSLTDKFWGALLLAIGMGIQNSAANRFGGVTLNHVFITGNLQKIGEELVSWMWPSPGKQVKRESAIFALAWFGYLLGAIAGALAVNFIDKPLILAACVLPFTMLFHEYKGNANLR
ncbi:protein of unknown function DUF1275 [Methylobacterium sp. 4-46]|uniref:YoaK family protein n=1 Tax=unclassified Methylobacterium TaxID=2615210 RepID=UPI000165C99E|nr:MULTISPECIES: YoaK family protein [Methylobacterium]ACA15762.1 protein of unknown function DUF1275 [Methylobacterium sp. 4-46]WFT81494.1 YoaK family protein [Methylobacterium nodulans]